MTATVASTLAARAVLDAVELSGARHARGLCPRQVLGVRIGLAGVAALGLAVPRHDKRLLTFVETDGCFVDGVEAATGCALGHRTLRLRDYGKVAATFVDAETGRATRVVPRPGIRARAADYAPGERRRYHAQLHAYQVMPEGELLDVREVALTFDLERLLGQRGVRVDCAECGEEILNGRELCRDSGPLCQACALGAYYVPLASP